MASIYSLANFRRRDVDVDSFCILDNDEENCLFEAIRRRDENALRLCVFLVDTGCHLSEALDLKWNDLQTDRVRFHETQAAAARTIPLTMRAFGAVEIEKRSYTGPFSMLDESSFLDVWNKARKNVKFNNDHELVPLSLRHTCASRLVQGGIDLRRVQLWLGHKTLSETMRYACFVTNELDPCVAVLEHDHV